MKSKANSNVMACVALSIGLSLFAYPGLAAPKNIVVNCDSPNGSLQDAVGNATGPTTIRFLGTCEEDVTVSKDDVVLDGQDVGTISGTVTFNGANRGVVKNATITGPGFGVYATNGSRVEILDNVVDDNVGSGILVTDAAFAEVIGNIVTGNGRLDHSESGIDVSRATVVAQSNAISGNAYAGITVYNFSSYRTGSFISPTRIDNDGPFEVIEAGDTATAVEIGQKSFADLRQVLVSGNVSVFRQSMLQIRGDSRGPSFNCSQIDGDLNATGIQALARIQFTNITGSINGTFTGSSTPTGSCDNLP